MTMSNLYHAVDLIRLAAGTGVHVWVQTDYGCFLTTPRDPPMSAGSPTRTFGSSK